MKKQARNTLVLSRVDIQHIVQHFGLHELMDALIGRLESAIGNFDPETTIIPIRSGFHYKQPHTGLVEWMPAYQLNEQVVIKVVGYHPENPDRYNLPTIISTISAYDTATGHLSGIMDGVFLTAMRTGAASAVASRALAHPDSSILGLIGCGAQAVTQLHALSRVFDLKKVLIYDISDKALSSLEARCNTLELEVDFVPASMKEIVAQAEILCTATSIEVGTGPLFEGLKHLPYLHINAVGSDFPGKVELPIDLLEKSFVCPDFRAQAEVEGECQQLSPEKIGADLAEVIKNRESYIPIQKRLSVFDSTGWALQDQVATAFFMECAAELGLGQEIEIENITADAKNPYHFLGALPAFTKETKIQEDGLFLARRTD